METESHLGRRARTAFVALAAAAALQAAHAGAIVSATGAAIDLGGPGFGPISNSYDQGGLLTGYTSGVTDFDAYIAGDPRHSVIFPNREWASQPVPAVTVTYDLGSVLQIDKVALWSGEGANIGLLDLLGSADGVDFTLLAGGLVPTVWPEAVNVLLDTYGADVFGFGSTAVRYVRFAASGCPFFGCTFGEVAFRLADINQVPEPTSAALAALGLALAGGSIARRRSEPQATAA